MAEKRSKGSSIRKTLFKDRYFSGTHNYFFELKVANNGSKYIVIDQRRKVGDRFEGVKMRIFEDEMLEFQRVLGKMINASIKYQEPLAFSFREEERA